MLLQSGALRKLHTTPISTPSPRAPGAPWGLSANLIASAAAAMLLWSVSDHRRRAMSRRYEPPSADVTAIQNSALASSPIVEIGEDCVMQEKPLYTYIILDPRPARTMPNIRREGHGKTAYLHPARLRATGGGLCWFPLLARPKRCSPSDGLDPALRPGQTGHAGHSARTLQLPGRVW